MANKFGIPGNTAVFTTKYVLLAKTRITYIEHDPEGDWYFFGAETIQKKEDYRMASLEQIIQIDKSVEDFADLPLNHYAFLDTDTGKWVRGENKFGGNGVFVSRKVLEDGLPVLYIFREEPDNESDSGWRVFSGLETDEEVNDPHSWSLVGLDTLVEAAPDVKELLDFPAGSHFERPEVGHDWIQVK